MARRRPPRTQPLLHLEASRWPAQPPPPLPPPPSPPSPSGSRHFKRPQRHRPSAPLQQRRQNRSPSEAAEHRPRLPLTPPQPLSLLGQLLPPQRPALGRRLNQHLERAPLVFLSAPPPPPPLPPQPHRALVQRPRLRAPPQPPSRLAAPLLSRLPPAPLSQHPVGLTLALVCRSHSLEHQCPIILHRRWEASTLGLLLLTNQLLGRLPHPLGRVLLQDQFPLEVLQLQSKASTLFLLGLRRLPPSPSEPDQSHPERGRGCRRGGNTTGRSNLRHVSSTAFPEDFKLLLLLLLLRLIWLTLLCSKPNIPHPGRHHALCFLPLLLLRWVELARNIASAEELERAHQLAEFMLPGRPHDPARGNVAARRQSLMYYT